MKNYQAFILILFLLSSCSQQQFAFRKKIAVTNANNVVMQYQPKSDTIQLATATASSQITYTEPTSFIQQQNELITENPSVLPDDTIRKKIQNISRSN